MQCSLFMYIVCLFVCFMKNHNTESKIINAHITERCSLLKLWVCILCVCVSVCCCCCSFLNLCFRLLTNYHLCIVFVLHSFSLISTNGANVELRSENIKIIKIINLRDLKSIVLNLCMYFFVCFLFVLLYLNIFLFMKYLR